MDLEQNAMHLILHGGNARSLAYEAFDRAVDGDFTGAAGKLREAADELRRAHAEQAALIQREAAGEPVPLNLLLVHGQDHLMTAMAEVNLMERLIRVLEVRR